MKIIFRTAVLLTLCLIIFTSMTFKPKRVIFFGDSVTQQGVSKNGYITLLKKALDSTKYDIIGAGIGGNKVYDLYLRLEDDVLSKKPDLVFIYVGINDIWHKETHHTGTDYDKYLKFYQALINKIQAAGSKVVLCTPSVIGEKKNNANLLDAELDKYSEGIRQLAVKNNLPLCDLRKAFSNYEMQNNPEDKEKGILTVDGVHLSDVGNKFLSDLMLSFVK
ncbi:G-D-S-L family lipolytic protein [Pedobacter changchengzhani]|uniref:G-D-S-L family lipolytic protein n=1 Tax=Pedobacter changchengzhani TaxID=2529274 RepID=A0A4R5MQK9_9SPHI|nr:SGNH/GDSL hydrolase family protein [Pedobacter changchengzhani]TDG37986.1 G-D-S-L family lipolytic protein [Pedobacter changchengzhani]